MVLQLRLLGQFPVYLPFYLAAETIERNAWFYWTKSVLEGPGFVHIGGKKEKQITQGTRFFFHLFLANFYYFVSGVGYYLI